ncbi:bacteriophage protein [Shigella sonnei]|nr:bacteriophage protein [Shigella sonnei]
MLKQQDMTETARVVFNELSVTEPATVGEIAQNTYLSRERCQLILTQLVMAGLADYQFGCYRRSSIRMVSRRYGQSVRKVCIRLTGKNGKKSGRW